MSIPTSQKPGKRKAKAPSYKVGPFPDDIFNFPYTPPDSPKAEVVTLDERFEYLVTNPQLHQVAREILPAPAAGGAGRPAEYPRYIYFIFLCAISVFGSARSTAAHLARPMWWGMLREAVGNYAGEQEAQALPASGPTLSQWNYAFRHYLKAVVPQARDLSRDAWIQQAIDAGMMAKNRNRGTWIRPERDQVIHGDATVAKPPSMKTHPTSEDKETGEIRIHRVDPDATMQTEGGGRRVYGNKMLSIAIRAADLPHSRIILSLESVRSKSRRHDQLRDDEGAAVVRLVKHITAQVPGLRAITYDTVIRGVHRAPLIEEGLVVYSPQHDGITPQPVLEYTDGPCIHILYAAEGRVCERQVTVDGETLYAPLPALDLEPRKVKRARFYHLLSIPCSRGDHKLRIRVDETKEDREIDPSTKRKRFNRTEHLRQIIPGTNAGRRLKGFRQDSEAQHSTFDQTYKHKAVPAYGADAALLIYIGFAWVNNSITRAKAEARAGLAAAA